MLDQVISMADLFVATPFDSLDVLYTLLFGLFIFCIMAPTTEFISAGVTLENMFHKLLGSENLFFVQYHLRRTALVRIICSSFVLLYFLFMQFLSRNVALAAPNFAPPFTIWDLFIWVGFALLTIVWCHTYWIWYANGTWSGHPAVRSLKELIKNDSNNSNTGISNALQLKALIASINAECRRPDKFVSGHGSLAMNWPGRRYIITDSWILATHLTQFKIIRQSSDELVAILSSSLSILDPSALTQGGQPSGESLGVQTMVHVRFVRPHTADCLLVFSVPATSLDEFRAKLQCPLIRAQGVELEPTIIQRFIKAFSEVVSENATVQLPSDYELEPCVGCMVERANVKLVRQCIPTESVCGTCHCRPMWCLDCLARWFASRQLIDEHHPSEWLSGRVPCPTCRTSFCVRDVSPLIIKESP